MAVKREDDETVVFSWVVWPSRQVRDEGMKAVMADPRLQPRIGSNNRQPAVIPCARHHTVNVVAPSRAQLNGRAKLSSCPSGSLT